MSDYDYNSCCGQYGCHSSSCSNQNPINPGPQAHQMSDYTLDIIHAENLALHEQLAAAIDDVVSLRGENVRLTNQLYEMKAQFREEIKRHLKRVELLEDLVHGRLEPLAFGSMEKQ